MGSPQPQQPYPGPWYLSPVHNPFCVSGAGFRNRNPYFPYYSLARSEYPGFHVPQSPVPTRVNRRPLFPVYHHTTQFWHYNGLGKKTKTKETQTDPQKPENKCDKQDIHSETNSHEIDSVASVLTTTVETETGNAPKKTSRALSSVAQERELHHKSSWNTTPYRNTPTGSYAFEKEDVRTDYGNGFPARQSSETFKEAILLHDLAYGKAMPEDKAQHNLISDESMAGVLITLQRVRTTLPIQMSKELLCCRSSVLKAYKTRSQDLAWRQVWIN